MKRIVALFLTLLFCGWLITAYAETAVPLSESNAICTLVRSGNQLTATAKITTTKNADQLKISSIRIQEKQNGKWVTVHTAQGVTQSNVSRLTKSTTYTGKTESKYRAVAGMSVTMDGVTRVKNATSAIK